jgi:hypothetical protein
MDSMRKEKLVIYSKKRFSKYLYMETYRKKIYDYFGKAGAYYKRNLPLLVIKLHLIS